MVKVVAQEGSSSTSIMGHGISVPIPFEISPGIVIRSVSKKTDLDLELVASGCEHFHEYAAVLSMSGMETFSLDVEADSGGEKLAIKTWNSLWLFHLLSIASLSPCFSLYCVSNGSTPRYSIANRNYIIRPMAEIAAVSKDDLEWAKEHLPSFDGLIKDARFGSAMRYFGNAHYLFDIDARLMLLWAGIECLLNVEAELSRRLALHSAILFDGTSDEKREHFVAVKKAYGIRSKVVHGNAPKSEKLKDSYSFASKLLAQLLRKCVELERVPTAAELDELAASSKI